VGSLTGDTRDTTLYLGMDFIALCEENTLARACVPALIFLLHRTDTL